MSAVACGDGGRGWQSNELHVCAVVLAEVGLHALHWHGGWKASFEDLVSPLPALLSHAQNKQNFSKSACTDGVGISSLVRRPERGCEHSAHAPGASTGGLKRLSAL